MLYPLTQPEALAFLQLVCEQPVEATDAAFRQFLHRTNAEEQADRVLCVTAWTAALLYDSVLCGTPLPDEEPAALPYARAVRALRTALSRRRFLSRRPVYNTADLLFHALDMLLLITEPDASAIAGELTGTGEYPGFVEEICALTDRLDDKLDRSKLTNDMVV
ncbi:MAG: hypothetical protein IJ055_00925 [Oscillospiraceae bacterium]|nr:hypothetical protein [Oscillospiraceae bacterium]